MEQKDEIPNIPQAPESQTPMPAVTPKIGSFIQIPENGIQLAPGQNLFLVLEDGSSSTVMGPAWYLPGPAGKNGNGRSDQVLLDEGLLGQTKKRKDHFSAFDFRYQIRLSFFLSYVLNLEITDRYGFVKVFMVNSLRDITDEGIAKILDPVINSFAKRSVLNVLRENNCSILDITSLQAKITEKMQDAFSKCLLEYGLKARIMVESAEFESTPNAVEMSKILLKAQEMKLLNYSYQDEHMTDFLKIVQKGEEVAK